MTTTHHHHAPITSPEVGGIGHNVRRIEDDRFIQGAGNYLDDVVLPGMLHMAIVRSPLAHARINSIDTSQAEAIDGVVAVVTGELLAGYNLAWMPTLSGDTQAVLATDKVRFQGQEVACVIADDPYIAKDACEAIVVEYEPLPVIVNPEQALAPDAPLIRDDKENQPTTWSSTGKSATRPGPTRPLLEPTSSPRSRCTTRGRTRRPSRRAARSPTSTGRQRSSPST